MKEKSLLFLRVSIGILMVLWGIDKLVNVKHGMEVSQYFYFGMFSVPALIQAFGVLQILLLALLVLALRFAYLVARTALEAAPALAIPIVIVQVLLSLLIDLVFDRFS